MFVAPSMSTPPKRAQRREELQDLRRERAFSKKVLLNCCLVRRVIAWAAPKAKGRRVTRGKRPATSLAGRFPAAFSSCRLVFVVDLLQFRGNAWRFAPGAAAASTGRPLTLRDAQILDSSQRRWIYSPSDRDRY